MAELMNGKLIFKGEGKNRRRHLVFTTRKGGVWDQPINPNLLSDSLRANTDAEVEVSFETDASGRPCHVRPVGEEWKDAPRPAPPPIRREDRRDDRRPQRREDQRRGQSERREHFQKLPGDFHNPYNFIPAPPRHIEHEDLGDHKPAGHDRFEDHLWSGRIAVKLTTETPLLSVDAALAEAYGQDHKIYPVRMVADQPYLPPTSIKGMLRSAYEAVTNSRMAVFEKHQDRLAYRMAAKIGPVPARVEYRGERLGLRIMPAAGVIGYAAKLPRYQDGTRLPQDKGESKAALSYSDRRSLPQHGDAVWVQVNNSWVHRIEPRTGPNPPAGSWQSGWVCVTGPNINRKRNERVFLETPSDNFIPITDEHESLWRELIQNYKETHERDLKKREDSKPKPIPPEAYRGDKPGQTGWSRHIYELGAEKLREGTLCYVEFFPGSSSEIAALIPVTISRRLYSVSPDALLPDSLKPAQSIERLSPAERVFGWVNQKGAGAYRGNVRIGPVQCLSPDALEKFSYPGLPLAILGQPKPQQSRFYASQSMQGEAQPDGLSKEEAGYLRNKGLRGRKVYPHHAGLPEGYWKEAMQDRTQDIQGDEFFQEYRRPHKPLMERGAAKLTPDRKAFKLLDATPHEDNEQRDDQNRSLLGWLKPQTIFEFEMDITDLSRVELGALLWLLQLPADHFQRLGGGKPLGFGSVSLAVVWEKTDLRAGAEWKKFYCSFDEGEIEKGDQPAAQSCVGEFTRAVADAYGNGDFENTAFIAAFRRCAQGFKRPVHYPRALQQGQDRDSTIPPHPEGKAFEWFVANERTGRLGGPKLALPDLVTDEGLPILEAR